MDGAFTASNSINGRRTRGRYTARACSECQRRKRKCSGESVCETCRHLGVQCVYPHVRGRERATNNPQSRPPPPFRSTRPAAVATTAATAATAAIGPGPAHSSPHGTPNYSVTGSVHASAAAAPVGQTASAVSSDSQLDADGEPRPGRTRRHRDSVFERDTTFTTGTALSQHINLLDRSLVRTQGFGAMTAGNLPALPPLESDLVQVNWTRDIDEAMEAVRSEPISRVHRALDMFFAYVQPHYPCINECYFRAQVSAFITRDDEFLVHEAAVNVAALLTLILAVVSILSEPCAVEQALPGWLDFCRSAKLLNHPTWPDRANILMIQTLLVKTLYLMYAGLLNLAYDTMGITVRLCFQAGLHNEPTWGKDCTFYDRTHRQRAFWSIFCLNQNVAQARGVPELLRESDLNVELPLAVDDRMLYLGCLPLPEMPHTSPVSYLLEMIKLTRLSSELWETMYGARAARPISQEFVIGMEERINNFTMRIPAYLRWPPDDENPQAYDGVPGFVREQGFILHLRVSFLRMLLRRDDMVSLTYSKETASLCIDIATTIITSVETVWTAEKSNRCRRQAFLHHLTGALMPMICIIVRHNNGERLKGLAFELLNRALKIIESFSHESFLARQILQQLHRPIQVARDAIEDQAVYRSNINTSNPAAVPSSCAVADPTVIASANTSNAVNTTDEWDMCLPSIGPGLCSEGTQDSTDLSFLWGDKGIDLWNNFATTLA